MLIKYLTKSSAQTRKKGRDFAKKITRQTRKKAVVLGLKGNLGGGKTTFIQGFAKGLGIKEKILSPTFVIMRKFKAPSSISKVFYHIDCYRIQKPKELLSLGFKEIISNPKNIVVIEWSDRIKKIMPKNSIWINFDFINIRKRKILFENFMLK